MIFPSGRRFGGPAGYFWPMPQALRFLLLVFGWSAVSWLHANGPVTWRSELIVKDGVLQVELTAVCEEGWHIYALELPRDDGPLPTVIRVFANEQYAAKGKVVEPAAEEVDDPNFGMRVRYHSGTVVFHVPIERNTPAAFQVQGEAEFMVCNDKTCLPPKAVPFTVNVPATDR